MSKKLEAIFDMAMPAPDDTAEIGEIKASIRQAIYAEIQAMKNEPMTPEAKAYAEYVERLMRTLH